ncbi:hypothetical protein KUTeg_019888 [Tegillarca granosa]|uniref:C-type lectin domain-containing protein n=1 Tax=Tegillarca granosa TaxID=220873 RepID=A0ABQ9EIW1_TEGGR|nr:hypothetical protein KUTeg_019888 [Tegillarca granosa]
MIVEDQWIYPSDLTQILVSNWASNQPNQAAGANCVATWYQYLSKWADEPCTTKYNFICERTIIGGEENCPTCYKI